MIEHGKVKNPKKEWKYIMTTLGEGCTLEPREQELRWQREQCAVYLDLAISRAALISGASVRNGSDNLKNECYEKE